MEWSEIERLDAFQILTSREKVALKDFLENGRDWLKAVHAAYEIKSEQAAVQMSRRLRHRQEIREILARIEPPPVPTAEEIASALYRIGTNPKAKPNVRADALDSAAVILGYKAAPQHGRTASEDESVRRAIEKFS